MEHMKKTYFYVAQGPIGASGHTRSGLYHDFKGAYEHARRIIEESYEQGWMVDLDPPAGTASAWENEVEWVYIYRTTA